VTRPMSQEHPVTAIVVTHNRINDLQTCLDALCKQTYPLHDVIVVDNASTDETSNFLGRQPKITVVRLLHNAGGAGGFKAGMTAAAQTEAHWWWLMDDDCVPDPNALRHLVGACVHGPPTLAGAAPAIQYSDGVRRCGVIWPRRDARPARREHNQIDCAPFLGILLRATACREVGAVRDDFFIHGDDTEYCLRLQRRGWFLAAVPDALVTHPADRPHHGVLIFGRTVNYPDGPPWKEYYTIRNSIIIAKMMDKTPRSRARTVVRTLTDEFKHIAILMTKPREGRERARMHLRGVADGLRGYTGAQVRPSHTASTISIPRSSAVASRNDVGATRSSGGYDV
jgi:rhamnopyranosyl-N-acetylglucosaminyl-diphospho-decaprenol beta-1,3/1,4-galactofuranosyltransferase